jgi:hypothetical protein
MIKKICLKKIVLVDLFKASMHGIKIFEMYMIPLPPKRKQERHDVIVNTQLM